MSTDVEVTRMREVEARLAESQERYITEKQRAESERKMLSMALEQAAESIIITDPNGTIIYVNPAFERVTGYTSGG